MYKHILIATDGSELAAKAVTQALELTKALNAKATCITVTSIFPSGPYSSIPTPSMIDRYDEAAEKSADKILSSVTEAAKKMGVACETKHVKDQTPAEGIIEAAQRYGCDLIVMASHGRRGVVRMLLGSQANKVLTLSPVAVLVCR